MIGRLSGILIEKKPPFLLIDVNGVGYEVQSPMSTIYQLPNLNESVVLSIHMYVREDIQVLYGFYNEAERALFRTLIKTSGVGPKMALTLLSGMDVKMFIQCVEQRDVAPLVRLPGVGKKTAERLIVEMAGKLDSMGEDFEFKNKMIYSPVQEVPSHIAENEAISALIALGYKPQEASRAVSAIQDEGLTSQELIRRALKEHGKVGEVN